MWTGVVGRVGPFARFRWVGTLTQVTGDDIPSILWVRGMFFRSWPHKMVPHRISVLASEAQVWLEEALKSLASSLQRVARCV